MHLRCLHCQNPIEIADVPSGCEITCTGCGSSFSFDPNATRSYAPEVKRLGKFEIMQLLGEGAFVSKTRDTELDRVVAIKVPRAGNVGSGPQDVDRFLREARAVTQLRFPSIISIHEVGINEGRPYLVCDFVEGVTLGDVLTGRRLTFHEAAKLIADVGDALQCAHSLGVVHRDVKPSNTMMVRAGSVSDGEPSVANACGSFTVANACGSFTVANASGSSDLNSDLKPVLMDFGLVKRDAGEIAMTIDGQILGTPARPRPRCQDLARTPQTPGKTRRSSALGLTRGTVL
jgi:serine/threonine protein kinase